MFSDSLLVFPLSYRDFRWVYIPTVSIHNRSSQTDRQSLWISRPNDPFSKWLRSEARPPPFRSNASRSLIPLFCSFFDHPCRVSLLLFFQVCVSLQFTSCRSTIERKVVISYNRDNKFTRHRVLDVFQIVQPASGIHGIGKVGPRSEV